LTPESNADRLFTKADYALNIHHPTTDESFEDISRREHIFHTNGHGRSQSFYSSPLHVDLSSNLYTLTIESVDFSVANTPCNGQNKNNQKATNTKKTDISKFSYKTMMMKIDNKFRELKTLFGNSNKNLPPPPPAAAVESAPPQQNSQPKLEISLTALEAFPQQPQEPLSQNSLPLTLQPQIPVIQPPSPSKKISLSSIFKLSPRPK